jgi:hypothetical protein
MDCPNYFGLNCWSDRWTVVEGTELRYYTKKQDEVDGKHAVTTFDLSSCRAELEDGLGAGCFKLYTTAGTITHRSTTSADAQAWVRLFNESQALKAPNKKLIHRLRASFSGAAATEGLDLAELNMLADDEESRQASLRRSEGGS